MLKKILATLLLLALLTASIPGLAEAPLTGNAQLIYDAIRWNLNLPKQSMLIHAEEYLYKLNKEITLHALLIEVSLIPELEMHYGLSGRLMVIDLDTGNIIDCKNFDGNVMWPEGDITSRYDALHLLYSNYWAYLEGYNENIMGEHEFITPVPEEDVAAINAALTDVFVR